MKLIHGGYMTNIVDVLKELAIIYGSTTISSLVFNKIYYNNKIQDAFDKSKRKLKYTDLSIISDRDLENVKKFCSTEKLVNNIIACLPLLQVILTVHNIRTDHSSYEEFFDKKIEEINIKELETRKKFLEEIKESREAPDDIKIKLEDEDYLPSEADYMRTKKLKRKTQGLPKLPKE